MVDLIRRAATDKPAASRAAAVAAEIAARGPRPGVAPIIESCEELLARPRPAALS
jgi:hypothetical protein